MAVGVSWVPAASADTGGGAAVPDPVKVKSVQCVASLTASCGKGRAAPRGGQLQVRGENLQQVASLVYLGKRGAADDVASKPSHVSATEFDVPVPQRARSGRLDVLTLTGEKVHVRRRVTIAKAAQVPQAGRASGDVFFADGESSPTLTLSQAAPKGLQLQVMREVDGAVIATRKLAAGATEGTWNGMTADGPAPTGIYRLQLAPEAASLAARVTFRFYDHLFPIRGKHDLGQSGTNNYGGGRSHGGQDMFAKCGTPLAAARGGRVRYAGTQARAGNYVVITSKQTGYDYVYMHLRDKPAVKTGDEVSTGQSLGLVGDTGNASGCHLHFELWSSPGWYSGGSTVDPLPLLRAWDGWS